MKSTTEIRPAAIDQNLSCYAQCAGIVRAEAIIHNDGTMFCLFSGVQNPKEENVFFLLKARDYDGNLSWYAVGIEGDCYNVKARNADRATTWPGINVAGSTQVMHLANPQAPINIGLQIILKETVKRYSDSLVNGEEDDAWAIQETPDTPKRKPKKFA